METFPDPLFLFYHFDGRPSRSIKLLIAGYSKKNATAVAYINNQGIREVSSKERSKAGSLLETPDVDTMTSIFNKKLDNCVARSRDPLEFAMDVLVIQEHQMSTS